MRLTNEELTALGGIASTLVKPSSITALCAYGSKVAGYARPDSDYDMIVVSRGFREGVRYRYVGEPLPSSALIVDEKLLREDAQTSYLGEFVVGRLLNVYEPISNEEFFRSVEVEYKKRVIIEALLELSSDYGDFGRHLFIPYDYFLFQKLSKRAAVYPPALYSYIQTYTCRLGSENRAISMAGFASAAEALRPRGFLVPTPGGVRLLPEKMKGDAFTKVQSIFSLTTRGVTQYAVHGYAGRVGISVFRREARSKLKRMRENPPSPPELQRPRSLLKLEEGIVIPDASFLVKELARLLGFATFSTKERYIGEPYSTTRVLTFRDPSREKSVVVKNYADVRSLKWALVGVWASAANKFSMAPLARLDREYGMTAKLRAAGVQVPAIIAVAPHERILVKEFVDGPTLSSVIEGLLKGGADGIDKVSAYATLMARVHSADLALGDAKASNVVVSPEGLFLTDLEQALPAGDRAWDVAEFLYYTSKLSNREEAMKHIARAFLESYASSGDRGNIERARGTKYFRPFQPFLSLGMAKMLRDQMAEFSKTW
jgi:tRNA A-37 threonylcarbamoyl transferase component Bud32/predicted nucleotidyltransferase